MASEVMSPPTERRLITAASRELVLRRSASLSRELRKQAQFAREAAVPVIAPETWVGVTSSAVREASARGGLGRWNFIVFALVPMILASTYFGVIASSQYQTESQFAVRAGETAPLDTLASLSGASSLQALQDTMVVYDYVKSRSIVEELEKRVHLRDMFARGSVDWISRFGPNTSMEALTTYWWWKVSPSIDTQSGIITVDLNAFAPEDSLKIGQAVLTLSEELINRMSERARNDVMYQALTELNRAEARTQKSYDALREIRDQQGLIDPHKEADGINQMIEALRLDRTRQQQDIIANSRLLSPNAPQVEAARARLAATDEQIAKLGAQLTQPKGSGTETLSSAIVRFDQANLERTAAENEFSAAATSYEQARVKAERQNMYVHAFVTPVLPQDSLYLRRLYFSLGACGAILALWLLGNVVWFSMHRSGRVRTL
jgi:capsular polysaccharide transport system permease protein